MLLLGLFCFLQETSTTCSDASCTWLIWWHRHRAGAVWEVSWLWRDLFHVMNPSACLEFMLLIPGFSKKQVWHFITFYFDLSLTPFVKHYSVKNKARRLCQRVFSASTDVTWLCAVSPHHQVQGGEGLVALPAAEHLTQQQRGCTEIKGPPLPNSHGDVRGCGVTIFDQHVPLGKWWWGAACTLPAAQCPRSHQPELGSL